MGDDAVSRKTKQSMNKPHQQCDRPGLTFSRRTTVRIVSQKVVKLTMG